MTRRLQRRRRWVGERGSMSLELAVLAPAVLLLLGLVVLAGRVQVAAGVVEQAAAAAARDASLARTPDAARTAATGTATATLTGQGITCQTQDITVDTTGFTVPLGSPAQVRVTLSCTVTFADVALPGIPGSRILTAQATSVLDTYRGR